MSASQTYSNLITLAEILRKVERSQLEFCETMVFNISSSSTPTSEQFSWTFSEFFSTANFWEAFLDCRCWLTFHNLTPKAIAAPTDRISKTRSGTRIFAFAVNKVWSGGHIATHLEMNNKYDFWLPSISRDIQKLFIPSTLNTDYLLCGKVLNRGLSYGLIFSLFNFLVEKIF